MTDSPEVAAAKRLLDVAKTDGFRFQRIAPGPDGPLLGVRDTTEHRDEIYLGGFGTPTPATPPGGDAGHWSCPAACP